MATSISRAGVTTEGTLTRSIPQSRGKKYLITVVVALIRAACATNSVKTLKGRISRFILRNIWFKILMPTRQMPQSGPSMHPSIVSRPSSSILPCFVEPEFISPFLDAQDLCALLSVNKAANDAVLKSPENLKILSSGHQKAECIKRVKEEIMPLCRPEQKSQILFEILKIQVGHNNLAAAKITAGQIQGIARQSEAFLEIVKAEAGRDLEAARITAGQIQGTYWQCQAFIEIAKAEVRRDLEAAKITAGQIFNEQDQALFEIVKAEVRRDLEAAKITAGQIQASYWQGEAIVEIAKAESGHDFEAAKIITAGQIQNNTRQGQVFVEIIKAEAGCDLEAAKITAGQIQNTYWQSKAFFEIVKAEAGHDFEAAKTTAGQIQDTNLRSQAFVEIVKAEAGHDLEAAKITAGQIHDPNLRSQAFVEIVKAEAGHDLEAAKITAGQIQNPYYQTKAFLEIAKTDPTHDMEAAKNGIESLAIDRRPDRFMDLFADLIKVEEVHNPVAARATIDLPRAPLWQVRVLIAILRNKVSCSHPTHDLAAAKGAAERIEDKHKKAWALGEIAKIEAKSNWEAACATAEFIEDPLAKALALLALCADA